jgi:hypothetical protein
MASILTIGLGLICLNQYLLWSYPEKYKSCMINISYNAIYVYSSFQLKFTKFYNLYLKTETIKVPTIEEYIIDDNSLYIYSDHSTTPTNKVILQTSTDTIPTKYEVSTCKFISLRLTITNTQNQNQNPVQSYDIKLKTDIYNYYVSNNKLDINFFIYYLREHNQTFVDKTYTFNVDIIDHKVIIVNKVEITDTKCIIIDKNSYVILAI